MPCCCGCADTVTPVSGLDQVTFIAAKSIGDVSGRDDWSAWLSDTALAHGGELWRLLDPGPPGRPGAGHSHVVHLDSERVETFGRTVGVARDDPPGAGHAEVNRDEWVRAGPGLRSAETDGEVTGLIVAQVLCVDPTRTAQWDAWYDDEHLPDMMASDAFVTGTRWRRRASRAGSANHLTVYEIAGSTVEEAIEASAAVIPDIIARGRKHQCHAGGLTWALERVR